MRSLSSLRCDAGLPSSSGGGAQQPNQVSLITIMNADENYDLLATVVEGTVKKKNELSKNGLNWGRREYFSTSRV